MNILNEFGTVFLNAIYALFKKITTYNINNSSYVLEEIWINFYLYNG